MCVCVQMCIHVYMITPYYDVVILGLMCFLIIQVALFDKTNAVM